MTLTYYKFLLSSLYRRYTVMIVGALFMLVYAVFLLIVPATIHQTPFFLWSNLSMSPLTFNMYIGAIFSAIVALAVFKEYRDDGTELILASKPLTRLKMIFVKFLVYGTFILGYSILLIFLTLFVYCFPNTDYSLVGSLAASIFISNIVFLTFFGALAIFISIFLNKVWTIILNVMVIVLIVIYSTVSTFTIKTPAQILSEKNHIITTTTYLDRHQQPRFHSAAAISPLIDNTGNIDLKDVADEQNLWSEASSEHNNSLANAFKFSTQFSLLNNMFGLQDLVQSQAEQNFGGSTWFKYQFSQQIIDQLNDEKENLPLFYVNLNCSANNIIDAGKKAQEANPDVPYAGILGCILFLIQKENIQYIGGQAVSDSSFSIDLSTDDFVNSHCVGIGTNGYVGALNSTRLFTYDDLSPSPIQKELFDETFNVLMFDSGDNPNVGILNNSVNQPIFASSSSGDFNGCNDPKVTNINEWFRWWFLQSSPSNNHAAIMNIDINEDDPYDLMMAILKFRFYAYHRCFDAIENDPAWDDTGFSNYDACSKQTLLNFNHSVLLPLPSTDYSKEHWWDGPSAWENWTSPYFYTSHQESEQIACYKALMQWVLTKDAFGFAHTVPNDDYFRDQLYVQHLNVQSQNFLLGYETLAASFTATPIINFSDIAIYWLVAAVSMLIIVAVIYHRIDFK